MELGNKNIIYIILIFLKKRYKCDSCFNYNLCKNCYQKKVPTPKSYIQHKPFHTFIQINGNFENDYNPKKKYKKKRINSWRWDNEDNDDEDEEEEDNQLINEQNNNEQNNLPN